MIRAYTHVERHQITRIGWLRAAVLGANDGIVSTASLIIGVAAAATARHKSWSPEWRGSLPVPCPWLPANTCQ